jgi:hypothetical protein
MDTSLPIEMLSGAGAWLTAISSKTNELRSLFLLMYEMIVIIIASFMSVLQI